MNNLKSPFTYLVIDDPIRFDIQEIREYREKVKIQKYIGKIPRGLLKFYFEEKWIKKLSDASGLPKELIRSTNSSRSGVHGRFMREEYRGIQLVSAQGSCYKLAEKLINEAIKEGIDKVMIMPPGRGRRRPGLLDATLGAFEHLEECKKRQLDETKEKLSQIDDELWKRCYQQDPIFIDECKKYYDLAGNDTDLTPDDFTGQARKKFINDIESEKSKVLLNIPPRHGKYRRDI